MNTQTLRNLSRTGWLHRLGAPLFTAALACVLHTPATWAQSSVEKAETSQQVQERVDELERATNIVLKKDKAEKPKTGMMIGDYSVASSMEFGYRTTTTRGSRAKFLSDVNIRDGWRVFDYSLDSRSLTGKGALYDFMHMDASGSGGDPQQSYSFRIDKARAYKFDASVRRLNYYRYLPNFSLNLHNIDTRQQISDFALKLFPQRKVRVNMGYNRSMATGFSQITSSANSDIYATPGDRRWESNDYRLGIDASHNGWDFFAEQSYRAFKWDTSYSFKNGVNPGALLPNDLATFTFFSRPEPSRSHAAVTRGSLQGNIAKRVHAVVRGMHSAEQWNGLLVQQYAGTNTAANSRLLINQYISNNKAKRPNSSFDAGISFDLTDNLTLNNSFRYSSSSINGEVYANTLQQTQVGTGPIVTTNPSPFTPNVSTALGVFTTALTDLSSAWNTLDLQYSRGRKLTANIGWRVTRRSVTIGNLTSSESDNLNTNTAIGSIRVRPTEHLNLFFDYEKGQADNVFVRINAMDFQRIRARANITVNDKLSFNTTFAATDRTNPTPQVKNDSDYRTVSVSALYEPNKKLLLNAGYNYDDLSATANIYYFIASQGRTGKSLFYAKQDFFFLDSRVSVTKYVDLLLVYRYLRDKGAPSSAPVTSVNDIVTAFPLKRHNPEARLAFHLNSHVTANLSYRHFSYNERNFAVQDYRSNILTSSLRLTF